MVTVDEHLNARLISRVISMYYLENQNQAEIGRQLGLSTTKVNRLLKQSRQQGLVEIRLNLPSRHLYALERQIEKAFSLREAIVIPQLAQDESTALPRVGEAAARYLLDHLQDGNTICMGGGHALFELIQAVNTERKFDVRVVPAIGGVQGTHYTDVNYLAAELARRLGGSAYQLHAPAFVDSPREKEAIFSLRHVKEILDMARSAQIALVGIGSLIPETSSYFQFTSLPLDVVTQIANQEGGCGEILARVYDQNGIPKAANYAQRAVGIDLNELGAIPLTIGLAASAQKIPSIVGALRGNLINTLITDEPTSLGILDQVGVQYKSESEEDILVPAPGSYKVPGEGL
jgi:DNA-binding transcriptional regulator LsrR (DeoR family)